MYPVKKLRHQRSRMHIPMQSHCRATHHSSASSKHTSPQLRSNPTTATTDDAWCALAHHTTAPCCLLAACCCCLRCTCAAVTCCCWCWLGQIHSLQATGEVNSRGASPRGSLCKAVICTVVSQLAGKASGEPCVILENGST